REKASRRAGKAEPFPAQATCVSPRRRVPVRVPAVHFGPRNVRRVGYLPVSAFFLDRAALARADLSDVVPDVLADVLPCPVDAVSVAFFAVFFAGFARSRSRSRL